MGNRLLLIGNDGNLIDQFFDRMDSEFTCITSSTRFIDINWHKENFNPDAVVFCMFNEDSKELPRVNSFKEEFVKKGKFIAIGGKTDLESFGKLATSNNYYQIVDPGSASEIKQEVLDVLSGKLANNAAPEKEEAPAAAVGWGDILNQLGEEENQKHILVIDDDPLMLKVIRDYLHEDYEVATAKGGQIAYKFLEKKHTDLVLLDYEMPDEKGPDVFKNIRAIPGMEHVPIVFLTGVKDKERLVEIVKVKPQGYISKPIERNALFEMIHKVLV